MTKKMLTLNISQKLIIAETLTKKLCCKNHGNFFEIKENI